MQTQEPAPRNEDVQEELRRLQNQVAQLGRRLQNTPESSQLDSGAGQRGARQATVPKMSARPWRHITGLHHPRTEDTWLHLHDGTCGQGVTTMLYVPLRETQQRLTDGAPLQVGRLPPAPASPRREVPALRRHVENVPITILNLSGRWFPQHRRWHHKLDTCLQRTNASVRGVGGTAMHCIVSLKS